MSGPATWQDDNDEFLAAALAWLRLRLAAHTAAQQARLTPARPESPAGPAEETPPPFSPSWWHRRKGPEPVTPYRAVLAADPLVALPVGQPDLDEHGAAQAMETVRHQTPPPALVRLGQLLDLSLFEQHTLLLCAAMELDPTMAARCAEAQGDPRLAYPTFALALSALPDPAWDVLSPHRGLRRWRLVEISQPAGQPLVTSALRADERMVNYLKGLNELDDRLEPLLSAVPRSSTPLPDSQRATVDAITEWCVRSTAAAGKPLVQLIGPDSQSKQLVAAEAAARLGLRLYRLAAQSIPTQPADLETLARLWSREGLLLDAALYVDAHEVDDAGQQGLVTRLLGRAEGLLLLAADEPWHGGDSPPYTVEVARPTPREQREAWRAALEPVAAETVVGKLAGQFNLNLHTINELAHRVPAEPATDLGERLWDACLAGTRPRMDALAQRLEPKATWDDLVLPAAELALLHQIADQVGQRSTVYERWGFDQRMNRGFGISALFAGPSGTGKTMAAEVIANELRLNLYRIDLSAVVSKYIGETEKNLRRLFDAAEEGSTLLFFDEADALFGKRSEVKDSHDRYANIETSYLLQRMEAYRGLAVLATNLRSALDQAFLRRLRFIVSFAVPGLVERRAIWSRAFPKPVPVETLDIDRLAALQATGGMIHNIALNAAFIAANAGSDVTMPIVLGAARTEFRKLEIPVRDRDFV